MFKKDNDILLLNCITIHHVCMNILIKKHFNFNFHLSMFQSKVKYGKKKKIQNKHFDLIYNS